MLHKHQKRYSSTRKSYQHKNKKASDNTYSLVPSLSQMENKINQKSASKNNLHNFLKEDFFNLLKRRWKIVAGVTCGITAIMTWWIFQQSPIYQGKFMVLLEKQNSPKQSDYDNNDNNQLIDNNLNNPRLVPQVDYSTEVQILGSPSVIVPILEEIAQEYPDIYEDINLKDLQDLKIRQIEQSKIIEVAFQDENPDKVKFVLDKIVEKYADENINPLQNNLSKGLKFVQSQTSNLQKKVDFLQDNLQKLRKKYKLIDPQVTAKELTEQFIRIEQQYLQAQMELEQANDIYKDLQKQLNLNSEEATAIISLTESLRYQSLSKQLKEIDIELAKQSAIFTDISPIIVDLKEKKENIIQLLEEEAKKFAIKTILNDPNKSSSIIVSAPSKIRSQLTKELLNKKREIDILTVKIKNTKQVLEKLNNKIAQMPVVIREYNDLHRELDVSTSSLTRLLKTQETLEIQNAQNTGKWEIISPPQLDKTPSLPVPPHNLIFVVFGGLILGTISAIIVDKLDNSIQTVTELKKITPEPILGCIPFSQKLNPRINFISSNLSCENKNKDYPSFKPIDDNISEKSTSAWIESFQDLYAHVNLLKPNNNVVYSVVISSANQAAGKSTISLNLAKTAATTGQRVLLVDNDLRLPQIHELLEIENSYGLSDVLTGKMDLSSVIKKVPQWDNLSVITAGKLSTDVTPLLFSPTMEKIIDNLSTLQQFDLIIYDTPSLLGFVDAKIIASHTDGLILVVELGKTQKNSLKQITEQLKVTKIPLLGMITNDIKYHWSQPSPEKTAYALNLK